MCDAVKRVAAAEHERWRAERLAAGWTYGRERDDVQKHNPLLVQWADLPAAAKDLFPSISMGSRKEGDTGSEVELIYGSHRALTDIRVKSGKTISPRKRFSAWLNTELGARPGDRIRVEKTGERQYTLTHIAF